MRKIAMKKLVRYEKGYILILALLVLLLVGLISGPLLSYMVSGLRAGHIFETGTAELYAVDAGVEDATLKIQRGDVKLCPGDPTWPPYDISVNNKNVGVTISSFYGVGNVTTIYRVESIATGDGSGTKIEAYVSVTSEYANYSGMMDHIVTVANNLTGNELNDLINDLSKVTLACREGCNETCQDGCGAVYDYYAIPEGCYGCGAVYNYPDIIWPTPELLAEWYWDDVEDETPYGLGTIDLNGVDKSLGPLYRASTLEIVNSKNTPATLTLTGTFYITGDTLIGQNGKDMTLNLNNHTIFVSSNTSGSQKALTIGDKCAINGPGIIIAVGDIYFAPKGSVGSNEEPVFIFSVSGTSYLQPSGDFYGSVAGSFDVEVKSGTEPTLTYPPGGFGDLDLNFPSLFEINRTCSITSWEVSRL